MVRSLHLPGRGAACAVEPVPEEGSLEGTAVSAIGGIVLGLGLVGVTLRKNFIM